MVIYFKKHPTQTYWKTQYTLEDNSDSLVNRDFCVTGATATICHWREHCFVLPNAAMLYRQKPTFDPSGADHQVCVLVCVCVCACDCERAQSDSSFWQLDF